MVTLRCKLIVKSELLSLGVNIKTLELGEVEILESLNDKQYSQLQTRLKIYGLELLSDRRNILIEKIKNVIVEMVHYSEEPLQVTFSDYLSSKLSYDYNYLSGLFSEFKGITIEQFIISHKIERVKELLLYDELTLTQIAQSLNYSDVSHLSRQFKKVTGLTPSFFKKMRSNRLKARDEI